MSSKNKLLVCAAVAGLSVGMVSAASAAEVNCWGVNSCGGKSAGDDDRGGQARGDRGRAGLCAAPCCVLRQLPVWRALRRWCGLGDWPGSEI